MGRKRVRGAAQALKLLDRPERLLATTLLGSNLSEITNTILVTAFFLETMGPAGEIVAMLLLPPLILILAEIIPKSIGRQHPNRLAKRLGPILLVVSWVLYPLTFIFARPEPVGALADRGAPDQPVALHQPGRFASGGEKKRAGSGPGDPRAADHPSHPAFSLRTVKEVMVPLIRVTAIPDTLTVGQALEEFRTSRFSRLPVYHHRIDNLIGVLHDFDLLGEDGPDRPIRAFMRPVTYVPELKKIDRLLAEMQRQGTHLAVVVDEYGGAVGIVTIEDLLEEIVGEITDEFDQEVAPFKKLGEGHYLISARTEIKALNETLHLELPAGDYETLAGFLISELGDLPRAGEQLQYRNLKFTVRQAEARAVKEVELFVDVAPE